MPVLYVHWSKSLNIYNFLIFVFANYCNMHIAIHLYSNAEWDELFFKYHSYIGHLSIYIIFLYIILIRMWEERCETSTHYTNVKVEKRNESKSGKVLTATTDQSEWSIPQSRVIMHANDSLMKVIRKCYGMFLVNLIQPPVYGTGWHTKPNRDFKVWCVCVK